MTHDDDTTASLDAAAFLAKYGGSPVTFGLLADAVSLLGDALRDRTTRSRCSKRGSRAWKPKAARPGSAGKASFTRATSSSRASSSRMPAVCGWRAARLTAGPGTRAITR